MVEGLVTTIIPVHNRATMLREAVASVLAQTYRPIEIIIVDDGSTDETVAVADDLAGEHAEVRTIHRENGGPGLARETGRLKTHGEFIQYLDSDDLLLPRKFELQVAALRDGGDVAYGRARYVGKDGDEIECTWRAPARPIERLFPALLIDRIWETAAPLFRATICERAGPWPDLWLEEDWVYDCRIALQEPRLRLIDKIVMEHRDQAENRLSRRAELDPWKLSQRARAHRMIYESGIEAGVTTEAPEMRRFSRELFLLSRQAGAAGLAEESRSLFNLARDASGSRRDSAQFRIYAGLASILGWTTLGTASCWTDRVRGSGIGDRGSGRGNRRQ